ncbi:MAG: cell division protein CrgA [Ilumatobacteraceae bacterium]
MAPPKRKTGGRVTPAGTKPGDRPKPAVTSGATGSTGSATRPAAGRVAASSRYTPPTPLSAKESPPWLPVVMLALFIVGGLAIMARYLIFSDSNLPLLVGLVCLLGGLFLATKWR